MSLLSIPGQPDSTPLVARGEASLSRADVVRLASDLASRIGEHGAGRVMLRTDDPERILAAIEACAMSGADLFIAHTNLSDDRIQELCAAHGIQGLLGEREEWIDRPSPLPEKRIFMMTSGTTGLPKVVSHSLDSLIARIMAGQNRKPDRGARWLLSYQPTGFAGLQVTLTAALTGGLVVAPRERTIAGFYEAARRWNVSHISGTPTFWRSFLMVCAPGTLYLRQITLGGEASDQATLDRLRASFPDARMTHTYASTEAGVVYAVHDGREGFPAAWLDEPPKGVALRIRDGFLEVRTAGMMSGYASAREQPISADGWLTTSDLVEISDGRVKVLGRNDDTINVGGSKVYPLPIEALILRTPGVREARVYGQPNPVTGALVAADVVLAADADAKAIRREILTACREALAPYQVPRVLNIVDEIATSASLKKVSA